MFISAREHTRLLEDLTFLRDAMIAERDRFELHSLQAANDLAKANAAHAAEFSKREVLSRQVAVQESFVEFLCQRVNQLEAERAILLRHLTSVDIPVPAIHQRPVPADRPETDLATMMASSIFEDDPTHAPKGWHPDGSVNYGS